MGYMQAASTYINLTKRVESLETEESLSRSVVPILLHARLISYSAIDHVIQEPQTAQICEISKHTQCSVSLFCWFGELVGETTQNPDFTLEEFAQRHSSPSSKFLNCLDTTLYVGR